MSKVEKNYAYQELIERKATISTNYTFYPDFFNPSKRNALSCERLRSMTKNMFWLRNQENPLKYMKTNFWTMLSGFAASGRHILYEPFRAGTQRLFESGIIDHHLKKLFEKDDRRENQYNKEQTEEIEHSRKILTLYMLSVGFYVWLTSVGISIVVFILEHIKFFFNNSGQTI
jgi:hypothetical protein